MQFKEKVWTYLEREIRKVASNDSELMQKINEQTQIIPDCLASTKVSNIVKQNDNLSNDHNIGCTKLAKIIKMLKKDLLETNHDAQNTLPIDNFDEKQEKFLLMKKNIRSTDANH